jgi:hypothetical protein
MSDECDCCKKYGPMPGPYDTLAALEQAALKAAREAGAKAERERILGMMEEMCDEDVADAVTFGQYATANDLLAQLKQRLGNE